MIITITIVISTMSVLFHYSSINTITIAGLLSLLLLLLSLLLSKEARKQGSKETRKQGSKQGSKEGSKQAGNQISTKPIELFINATNGLCAKTGRAARHTSLTLERYS